ncbi:MAG TPA: S-methyl-5-thioribose-1-phosphate isomerase [Candidatus Angelobacter sp.]|nr:S-methyl-5-thioribose-1-phosphate isomerase [Candidatus Angelobacter sp.]
MIKTLEWTSDGVRFIDQTRLPAEEVYVLCRNYQDVATAIRDMIVRGAPAIGVAAAMGVALGVNQSRDTDLASLRRSFEDICNVIGATRPTAVNLFWAIQRIKDTFDSAERGFEKQNEAKQGPDKTIQHIKDALVREAQLMYDEDIAANESMGLHGAALMPAAGGVLTHCNAGALATCGYGTALGVIRAAIGAGKKIHVFADETRPFLQGARLTAWELINDGIDTTLIADNMAGAMMKQGKIHAVVVGADRIASNGDVANKIGTYTVAILAKEHGIPFYVAAPWSTVDMNTATGDKIPIEQRSPREVTHHGGKQMAPDGVHVENPAFDVTPNKYVTAIITERGVARPDYAESLRELASKAATSARSTLS